MLFTRRRSEFLSDLDVSDWERSEIVALATCFPFNATTWNTLEKFGTEVVAEYWNSVHPQPWRLSEEEFAKAITSLLEVGRGLAIAQYWWTPAERSFMQRLLLGSFLRTGLV